MGKGNIAVVSPSGTYDNMVHENQSVSGDARCESVLEVEDNVFCDAAIRRGKREMDRWMIKYE